MSNIKAFLTNAFVRVRSFLTHAELDVLEICLAVLSLGWGLWVLFPWWDSFASNPAFVLMDHMMPEFVWGLVLTSSGTIKLLSIHNRWFKVKRWTFRVIVFVWSCIALSFVFNSPQSPGTPVYSMVLVANIWCAVRA